MNAKTARELTNEVNNRIDECKIYQAIDDIKITIEGAAGFGNSHCRFRTRHISPYCKLKKGTEGDEYNLNKPEILCLVNEITKQGFQISHSRDAIDIKW